MNQRGSIPCVCIIVPALADECCFPAILTTKYKSISLDLRLVNILRVLPHLSPCQAQSILCSRTVLCCHRSVAYKDWACFGVILWICKISVYSAMVLKTMISTLCVQLLFLRRCHPQVILFCLDPASEILYLTNI